MTAARAAARRFHGSGLITELSNLVPPWIVLDFLTLHTYAGKDHLSMRILKSKEIHTRTTIKFVC